MTHLEVTQQAPEAAAATTENVEGIINCTTFMTHVDLTKVFLKKKNICLCVTGYWAVDIFNLIEIYSLNVH